MQERLTDTRRLEIDALSKRHPHVTQRLFVAEGVLLGKSYRSERDRTHFLNVVGDGYRYYMEEGVHPSELGMWIHGVFEWMAQQTRTVPDIKGLDIPCEVGPEPIQRW